MKKIGLSIILSIFCWPASAQTIYGPLQAQNNFSEITANGTQATAQVNLFGFTITLGGNFSTSGANSLTFTTTGTTNVTLPTSGTLFSTTSTIPYSNLPALSANQILGSLTATTPSGQSVPSCTTATNALQWTSGTGFGCNSAINAATLGGATFAAPGPIGSTTASTGAFTTLSASSTVSGTGFSTYLASPPPIGSTSANTGAFTTLSASSTVSGTGFSTYLASPPPIGSTAASTGAFTTLSASSTVSGTGFSTYLASPPSIGGTTPASGKFTTLQATSTITPSTTAGIVGTTLGDNANAGSVGEFISSSQAVSVSITSNTATNVTSVSLSAGDWECIGQVSYQPAGSTVASSYEGWVSTSSTTVPGAPNGGALYYTNITYPAGAFQFFPVGVIRENISTTTTVYLETLSVFTTSTNTAGGFLGCRRVR